MCKLYVRNSRKIWVIAKQYIYLYLKIANKILIIEIVGTILKRNLYLIFLWYMW